MVEEKKLEKNIKEKNTSEESLTKVTEVKEVKEESSIEKKPENKKKKEKIISKEFAIANGYSARISTKDAIAVCKVIKGKSPTIAIKRLEDVLSKKRSIPMKNREVPHQKGHGVAGARFPKKACEEIIKIIKQVEANAIVSGVENPVITLAIANIASRPFRRGGTKAKRTHIHLEVKDKTKLIKDKK